MKDAYSFDIDDAGLDSSYQLMRDTYERIFKRLNLPYVICEATSGAMGGSRSEEFLMPCGIGEDTFVVSDSGYAANTEAVTTPELEELDPSGVPEPEDVPTPGAGTIEELVDFLNANHAGKQPWTASNTLKNVVLTAVSPDGDRELFVVGVPGDREVDLKRIEASLSPFEVEVATAEDLEKHPELVVGYIGPRNIGPNSARRKVGKDGEISGSVRYFVDPRVRRGSSWVSGADAVDTHTLNLVYGRDFSADGVLEAVEVRAGDLAPDGSQLRIERGIEIGHIFQLGRKYADALDLKVLDQNGKATVVTMGSYGIGVSRIVAALAELNHDDLGITWPAEVAPAHVHVIATGKDAAIFETASQITDQLRSSGVEVIFDDRVKVSAGVKFADYELIGLPYAVVVGRGLRNGVVEIRDRRAGTSQEVAPEQVAGKLAELLR